MAIDHETEMTDAEVDAFLARHETGVLSLARTDEPYAIPISYGYDGDDRLFYMRMVSTPESEKRTFLESDPGARLVVYDERESTYRSVIATGTLENIPPSELTPDQIAQYGDAKRPLFEIWAEGKRDLDIELYRLTPESVNGRRTEVDRAESA
ncbi:pyridoxamine 5'-phosphate oxidase family protein [Natrarchaeobius sp. A-rgal3]|uniref:pyridoxamine 5'-phosphate oxidase family protein n=1 Tax=Natrarchaeobius versutus TaxID=1679078 RepID=UPI0035100F8C